MVCVALLGAALLVPVLSSAANSKVTIGVGFRPEVGNPRFHGEIRSGSRACTRGRVVSVFRVVNKGRVVRFGSTRSGRRGHWRIVMNENMVTGGYFARVKARGSCAADKSREIAVGQNGPGGTG